MIASPHSDEYPLAPRGCRTLVLCPRPSCRGDAHCPEMREHLFLPLDKEVRR
jgi:hypothetical protein